MNQQQRCLQLLETREHGFRIRTTFVTNWRAYLLNMMLLIAMAVLATFETGVLQLAFVAGCGMLTGAIFRDLGWLRRMRQNWPLSERITDRDEVERIAGARTTPKRTGPD